MDSRTREFVRNRAGDLCEYCRLPQSAAPYLRFHIEHIVALQHANDNSRSNLALACPDCNRHKGPNIATIFPESDQLIRLFDPRNDNWFQHFYVQQGRIEGLSVVGKATARLLQMNSEDRVVIRLELIEQGLFS